MNALSILGLLCLLQAPPPQDPVATAKQALDAILAGDQAESRAAAEAWRTYGKACTAARRSADAIAAYRAQLALRDRFTEHAKDRFELASTRVDLANALRANDQHDEAIATLEPVAAEVDRLQQDGFAARQVALLRIGEVLCRGQILVLANEALRARPMFERTLELAMEALGPDDANTQVVRQSLAASYAMTGEVERARALAADSLRSAEKVSGPEHLKTAHAAYVLGQFERMAGRLAAAAKSFDRAASIRGKLLGPKHPDTVAAAFASVQLLAASGEFAAVRPKLEDLLARVREALGPEHDQTIDVEDMLAEVLAELRRAHLALPLSRHVVAARTKLAAQRPSRLLSSRLTLARVLHGCGEFEAAVAELEQVLAADAGADPEFTRHVHQRLANFLPAVGRDAEAIEHARINLRGFQQFLAARLPVMLDQERITFVQGRRQDLEMILSLAASESEVSAAWSDGLQWKAQVARGLFAQREWLRRTFPANGLAMLDALPRALGELAAARRAGDAAAVARLQAECDRLQTALPQAAPNAEEAAGPQTIQRVLGADEVLVDFFVYERSERIQVVGKHLMAFVVVAGKPPERVDFGALEPIQKAVAAQLQLTSRRTRPLDAAGRATAAAIDQRTGKLLWQPLASHVAGKARVFVCADGVTALLPFGVLPGDRPGTFLLEQHEFVSLVSPLDLLAPTAGGGAGKAVLVGAVDYGAGEAAAFMPLPATGDEVRAIAATLGGAGPQVVVMTGAEATLAKVQEAARGTALMHFATHGVFDGKGDALPGQRGGIALAGANAGGVVTAGELAWLDLRECRLAVLSACDTGNGEATLGEHVLGLRRSLRLAGARSTLTSAWRIDDAATAKLMVACYRALAAGVAPAAALRQAQLAVIAEQRAAGEVLPGTWGAFVVEGR